MAYADVNLYPDANSGERVIPATAARLFGWISLAVLFAFLVNNVLTWWVGWPGFGSLFGWKGNGAFDWRSVIQMLIYVGAIALAVRYVRSTGDRYIRSDARRLTNWNITFIRCAFWVVVLIGMVDAAISFMRIEGFLELYVGDDIAADLVRSQFRGLYVHVPIVVLGILIGLVTRGIGFTWLALLVVLAELVIVFTRFVLSYEQAFMGDLVRFWYAALFLFASAYTLLEDGHVRVDVFYAGFSRRGKAWVNGYGSIVLGMTLCWTIILLGMWANTSIVNSPILVFETTQAGFGLYVKYFMAAFLGIFATSMMIQFTSLYFDSAADRRDEPGARETAGDGPAH